MSHTPGPWRYSTAPQPNGCPIIGAGPLMVAMLAHTVNDPTQRETAHANARLIATAPELLDALVGVEALFAHLASDSTQKEWLDRAVAAITKATGK